MEIEKEKERDRMWWLLPRVVTILKIVSFCRAEYKIRVTSIWVDEDEEENGVFEENILEDFVCVCVWPHFGQNTELVKLIDTSKTFA